MKNFDQFVNEKFEFATTTLNGKKVNSTFQGKTSNMNDFIKHIKELPETLKSIKVPVETSAFSPNSETFDGPIKSGDKAKIIKIIKDVTKEFKKMGDPIYEYGIRSFYGVLSADREVKDPVYVSFRTKAHDKFGQAMSRGDHGSLD